MFNPQPPPHQNDINETQVKQILKASYKNPSTAKSQLENLGYTYVPKFSDNENKVFLDKQGNPHIAFRGTKPSRVSDIVSDVNIILGREQYDPRFKKSKQLVKDVEKEYNKPVNVYGDSLGGTLARRSGATGNIYMHNPALNWFDIGTRVRKNEFIFKNTRDPVSFLSPTLHDPHKHIKQKKIKKDTPLAQHRIYI